MSPRGSTAVAAVIGDPVAHTRSPAIHNAAFATLGLDWVYVALRVAPGSGAAAVEAMRVLGLSGLSVTMPHKEAVIPALDALTPTARRLGAVNCITADSHRLTGHNTDGSGFIEAMRAEGAEVAGARCVVAGAGGAARSVVLALAEAGAQEVAVAGRTHARVREAVELAGGCGRALAPREVGEAVAEAELLVNATPLGMSPGDELPVPAQSLHAGLRVADLVYHPQRTALMEAAEQHGAACTNGLAMLVHQAAAAFTLWTGLPAPVSAMAAAAQRGSGERVVLDEN